jgi:hypothetical protein
VFGRRGARPLNREETQRLYLRNGRVYTVTDEAAGPQNSAAATPAKGDWIAWAKALISGWY